MGDFFRKYRKYFIVPGCYHIMCSVGRRDLTSLRASRWPSEIVKSAVINIDLDLYENNPKLVVVAPSSS